MALTMSALLSSSCVISSRTWSSTDRAVPSRPSSAMFSSRAMVRSWATPPPLSSRLSAPSTSSTSGLRPLRSRGITSPLASGSVLAPLSGAASDTNFSPSRLVCRIDATALSGSSVPRRSWTVTSAVKPSSRTSVTLPTLTSFTFTDDCGTRSSTSRNMMCTVTGSSPTSVPPGSGSL